MAEIKCPKCGEVFTVDESNYQKIVSQVRNEEFEKELSRRLNEEKNKNNLLVEMEKNKAKAENDKEVASLKEEISRLKNEIQQLKKESLR